MTVNVREGGARSREGRGEPARTATEPTPLRMDSWFLTGPVAELRDFLAECLSLGWEAFYREDLAVKGGERWWLTLAKAGSMKIPGTRNLEELPSHTLRASRGAQATIHISFLATEEDERVLFGVLAKAWRLSFSGHDGGWGGEPHFSLKRRPVAVGEPERDAAR